MAWESLAALDVVRPMVSVLESNCVAQRPSHAAVYGDGPMKTNEQQIQEWMARIRRRRLLAHGPIAVAILVGLATGLARRLDVDIGWSQPLLEGLFIVGIIAVGSVKLSGLLCPRCSKPFHMGPRFSNNFTRKCLNCGLHLRPRPEELTALRR